MSCLLERKSQKEGLQGNNSLSFLENNGRSDRVRCADRILQDRAVSWHAVLPLLWESFIAVSVVRAEGLGMRCFMLALQLLVILH